MDKNDKNNLENQDDVELNETVSQNESSDENGTNGEKKHREFRGLYKHVKISVRTLDIIIIVCVVVIIGVVAFDLITDPGFKVTFDSKGGTDVASQNHMYGQLLDKPEDPKREGYTFEGWYKDPGCSEKWDMEKDKVDSSFTLYAGWKSNEDKAS